MKTLEFELQELTVEAIRTGIRVNYDLVDDSGVANIKQVIPTEKLLEYVIDNSLNVYIDYELSPCVYLLDNLYFITKSYLEENYNA